MPLQRSQIYGLINRFIGVLSNIKPRFIVAVIWASGILVTLKNIIEIYGNVIL